MKAKPPKQVPLGIRYRQQREAARLSLQGVNNLFIERFPLNAELRLSPDKLLRFENGRSATVPVVVRVALAELYGTTVKEIGDEEAAREAQALRDLLIRTNCWITLGDTAAA